MQEISEEMAQQYQKSQSIISELSTKVKQLEVELERKINEISQLSNFTKEKDKSNPAAPVSPSKFLTVDAQQVFFSLPIYIFQTTSTHYHSTDFAVKNVGLCERRQTEG